MRQVTRRHALLTFGALTLAAACSTAEEKPTAAAKGAAMEGYGVGKTFKAPQQLTFPILHNIHPAYPVKDDWLFWSELAKRTNVKLQTTLIPFSDYDQKKGLLISAGQAPLIVPKMYPGQEVPYIASGVLLPVSDYVEQMPHFMDKVTKWQLQGDLDTLRQNDGKYYVLPGLHEKVWSDYSFAVRTDILQELGLQAPKTWDDFHAMLKAMKEKYPDEYPFSDRWGIPTPGGAFLQQLGNAYGTNAGWNFANGRPVFWDDAAQKFIFTGTMPQYKQVVEYAAALVKEGLMDPESFTQKDDAANAKFTSGKSFVISSNAQSLVNDYRKGLAENNPKATVVKIPVPVGPMGETRTGLRTENGIVLMAKAKDDPNFAALLQFVDWLFYSDEGQLFAKWGVEGVTYTKDASGKITPAKDVDMVGLNPGAPKHLQKDFGFGNGVFAYGGTTALLQSTFSEEELEFQNVMNARQNRPLPPPAPLDELEQEQATLWETPLKDHVQQNTLNFILGKRDLAEWDAYAKELEGKNLAAYVDLINKAHVRFKEKHG
ncbi:extracellular solute-binding protein [Nonomuraea soli]|uniref:Putative aldouronate transport system substrate-binding protein n=1 Tax=Nonomuraea soli TaxID=1032476 RepID=A0A7W0CGZ6_9ACTN|nr:extracellular solute-binding protein [Nonomuraea soli]MBA2890926.1 putative aldouronate transport system substrate-binding protein [Nonomuraea soli]